MVSLRLNLESLYTLHQNPRPPSLPPKLAPSDLLYKKQRKLIWMKGRLEDQVHDPKPFPFLALGEKVSNLNHLLLDDEKEYAAPAPACLSRPGRGNEAAKVLEVDA